MDEAGAISGGKAPRYGKTAHGIAKLNPTAANSARIMCVGDLLGEPMMQKAAYKNGVFDFRTSFQFVKGLFEKSDLLIGNLETLVSEAYPYAMDRHIVKEDNYTRYLCNSPPEYLAALRDAGFDVLAVSNNHNLDYDLSGLGDTVRNLEKYHFPFTGVFAENQERHLLVSVNGINIALLSYCTFFNRNENKITPQELTTILNKYSAARVRHDIAAAKEGGAEFILVYMHWGIDTEYRHNAGEVQRRMARELADAGADYIVGSHPHALQEYDVIRSADGRGVPVVYALGNFYTSDNKWITRNTAVLAFTLQKGDQGVRIADEHCIPCWVPNDRSGIGFPIIPAVKGMNTSLLCSHVRKAGEVARNALGSKIPCPGLDDTPGKKPPASPAAGPKKSTLAPKEKHILDTKFIHDCLGIPAPKDNRTYAFMRYAIDAGPNDVAFIQNISSDPSYLTPEQRCYELADLAIKNGASLLVTTKQMRDYPCLVVDNVFHSYTKLCAKYRDMFSPLTVAITGSIGKTTSTQLIYAILKESKNVHWNTGTANNVRYAGSVIQKLQDSHEIYVQEIMEGPPYGAAGTIAKMVKPHAAVITKIGTSHLEFFKTRDRILESCLGVQDGMPDDGILFMNADDEYQANATTNVQKIYFGIANDSVHYRAVNIQSVSTGIDFEVMYADKKIPVHMNLFGDHNIYNALAAFAVAKWAGIADCKIQKAIGNYISAGIRQHLFNFGGYSFYIDCYNAAPESIQASLNALTTLPMKSRSGRRIAVLADMLELGEYSDDAHDQAGSMAAASDIDILICYGAMASRIAEAAKANPHITSLQTTDEHALIDIIADTVTPDDVVLFKGSHGMKLELVIDKIYGTWFHEEYAAYNGETKQKHSMDFQSVVYPDYAKIAKFTGSGETALIPGEIDSKEVWSIGVSAFTQNSSIKNIEFPETLRTIRYCAFYKCQGLTSVYLPEKLKVLDRSSFSACENLQEVFLGGEVLDIGRRAFANCKNLRRITIPPSVGNIGEEAFLNCKNLTIYGQANSYAEVYAKKNNIPFSGERIC